MIRSAGEFAFALSLSGAAIWSRRSRAQSLALLMRVSAPSSFLPAQPQPAGSARESESSRTAYTSFS